MKKTQNEGWCYQSIGKFDLIKQLVLVFTLLIGFSGVNRANAFNVDVAESSQQKEITGTIFDSDGNPIPGVTIYVKGTIKGVTTDFDGNFSINLENENAILVISSIGMTTQEISVSGKSEIIVTLENETEMLDDIVIVGYGRQKKESVVGAITQATGEDLQRSGGVTNVGEALQGRLPGVTSIASSGLPGQTDPRIFIRGQSSWNGSGQPLILVDGVERSIGDIDLNEIASISVLKDASATAVFGVKGGNGVILLTTKRGRVGKAKLSFSANTSIKTISKLPQKLESYDAIQVMNEAIMREVMHEPSSWNDIVPMSIAEKFRNPASLEESYIYPNVDWEDVILKDFATDTRVNLSVRGGSELVKYFGSLAYQSTRDIFKGSEYSNDKGYASEFKYDRFNYRSNLDFNITKTTKFTVNLSGYVGIQEKPTNDLRTVVNAIYEMAPSLYTPVYPDGLYGRESTGDLSFSNPIVNLINSGYDINRKFQVNSDFELEQKLDVITEGLRLNVKFSYDNTMSSRQRLKDNGNVIYRYYDLEGNEEIIAPDGVNDFDYVIQPWVLDPNQIDDGQDGFSGKGSRMRRLNYEASLNYNRTFAQKHNTTALFLFKREQYTKGSRFPRFREDWVGRMTYNYDSRYFLDVNGAYNGSEQFGKEYRFDLFPSAAVGWVITNEAFMESTTSWLDKLKLRASYGSVGDDGPGDNDRRWKYSSQWGSGGYADLDPSTFGANSPYLWYAETVVGNPDLQWETAIKANYGIEVSLLGGKLTADFDYFTEDRDNILIIGSSRSVPDFYGTAPPDVNTGKVEVKGYELVLGFNHTFDNDIDIWSNFSYTNARDKIIYKEDPALSPFYSKAEGYPIGQSRGAIPASIMQSWDDIYMATPITLGQGLRRPGYYDLADYNGDGNYNGTYDNTPYGYPIRPQKTWTLTTGARYKGLNLMVMFYGAQNATRTYNTRAFTKKSPLFFEHAMGYWSIDNPNSKTTLNAWSGLGASDDPRRNSYDASVVRLKTVEISYDIPKNITEKLGIDALKVFANGNNLYLWSNLPDDREFNGTNTQESQYRGDYPTMKRFNVGVNLNF